MVHLVHRSSVKVESESRKYIVCMLDFVMPTIALIVWQLQLN